MNDKKILTGITTTGTPHLGNYVGAIRPAIASSEEQGRDSFFFLADYHALIKSKDRDALRQSCLEIAATWIASGLDINQTYFYRQSDIPEILELNWILANFTAKGLMNRAHAYKAAVDENEQADPDKGITMGLFSYPVLMAADILMFKATHVPVGQDQIQHIEMTRDIAKRFNHHYGEIFVIPEGVIDRNSSVLPGLDGRKMSKSYGNLIPLFCDSKTLRKYVMKIKTNSIEPGEPKSTDDCLLFDIYKSFASESQINSMKTGLENGMSWGDAKNELFELLDDQLSKPRLKYDELINDPSFLVKALDEGAERARSIASSNLDQIKSAIGLGKLS
ncbi:MAG TPA: tryptophan--tRNA ligase [Gammaproteobacteria bacterium]|nr:tryptophan--tRNA ligase [Gammaproteobacteria bacterium]MBQ09587.1 tryptophan--tRNA ligase [Gammaproteobacteria bacterium]HJL79883.1 tryptophan--tRNA ligase [Gammaproteobacteria bacterium]HJM99961.1 tryptophan--tRNA ligase [Gammaproteobacteria bacterium]